MEGKSMTDGSTKKKILIVDDENDLRETLVYTFQEDGFQVFEAASGKEAYDVVLENSVDIVLSDVRMPNGNGIELLDRLKQNNPASPKVLLISGYTDMMEGEAFFKGADAFLDKPFTHQELIEAVAFSLIDINEKWNKKEFQSPSNRKVEGNISTIGRGGFFLPLLMDLPEKSDVVSFRVVSADQSLGTLSGTGIIRWTRYKNTKLPPGCGVEFLYLDAESRPKVLKAIEKMENRSFIPLS
jgi:two-component system response regulator (stage 0 sporulation protein F)